MWEPKTVSILELDKACMDSVLDGTVPALIIKQFYSKLDCCKLLEAVKKHKSSEFKVDKLNHIGTFLMAHATNKKQYFEDAKKAKQVFEGIFCETENPMKRIHEKFQHVFPKFNVTIASENHDEYSRCIIRVHEKGKKIPIHKDNISYEGKEYSVSNIDKQLSCVLHLQKPERGGELTIYDKKWTRQDEKNREITFGYSDKVISDHNRCQISSIEQGDMTIINPNYYHSVSEIVGTTPRITLGMFLGLYLNKMKIVSWA